MSLKTKRAVLILLTGVGRAVLADLANWIDLPGPAFVGPFFNFTDIASPTNTRLFYRVRQE